MDKLKELVSKLQEAKHKLEQLKFWITHPEFFELSINNNGTLLEPKDLDNLLNRINSIEVDTWDSTFWCQTSMSRDAIDMYLAKVINIPINLEMKGWNLVYKTYNTVPNPERVLLEINAKVEKLCQLYDECFND